MYFCTKLHEIPLLIMKNILVPIGNKKNGINNLKYAINFAAMTGAKVYVINLFKEFSKVGGLTKVNQMLIEESKMLLDEVLSQVDTKGVTVITKPIKGDPYEGIKRISEQLQIDLVILSPQSIEINDEVYLGKVASKLVKQTNIPLLIVPRGFLFRKFETILLALKNGYFETESIFNTLNTFVEVFSAKLKLLQVITPDLSEKETVIDSNLQKLAFSYTTTKNATIFQGVLENFQSAKPDLLCVIRRKRGFFKKLWDRNVILKKDFHTSIPLLVLKGKEA